MRTIDTDRTRVVSDKSVVPLVIRPTILPVDSQFHLTIVLPSCFNSRLGEYVMRQIGDQAETFG
jgi:hypothetical protein